MPEMDGWVSAEFQNLADTLYDYDQNLRLEMIPGKYWDQLLDKSKIFRVVDVSRGDAVVMTFSAISSPQDILAEIWSRDLNKNDVVGRMDKKNAAAQALEMRKHIDEIEEQKEFAHFVVGNEKSRWHHNGRVRDEQFNDLGPVRKVIT